MLVALLAEVGVRELAMLFQISSWQEAVLVPQVRPVHVPDQARVSHARSWIVDRACRLLVWKLAEGCMHANYTELRKIDVAYMPTLIT